MKRFRIELRVTVLEKKVLVKKAHNSGLSLSEYIRQTALGIEPKFKLTMEEIECYKELHQCAIHFKNISNMYKNKNPLINDEVRLVIQLVKDHLIKFQ